MKALDQGLDVKKSEPREEPLLIKPGAAVIDFAGWNPQNYRSWVQLTKH